ncbi:odorant receptor 4-like [Xylocopa sonorina]|uniref:odorant receptor 4-like n=1 Tax=Xylocopa sonorina TaxID=1818115 RepID=UPI00403AF1D6
MPRTRNVEEDLKQAFRFVQAHLVFLGAWPSFSKTPLHFKILRWCRVFVVIFLQLSLVVPAILYMILKEKNGKRKVSLMAPIVFSMGQAAKYLTMLYRKNDFGKMLNMIKKDWLNATEEDQHTLRANARIGYKVALLVAISMSGSGLFYRVILPLTKGTIVLPNNVTIRLLPCQVYFVFFDVQLSPYFEMVFTLQVCTGIVNYATQTGTVGVFAILCLHICSLLRILIGKLIELTRETDFSEKVLHEKIVDIVEYQTKIKGFIANVELITQYLCFYEIVDDTCITCILGYCTIVEFENHNYTAIAIYFFVYASCTSFTFALCYVGQHLIDESTNLAETSNTLRWYRLPTKKARSLVPVIIMSNYPIKLTAAKLIDVSLATFTDIMKTSMGYLNLLREVT